MFISFEGPDGAGKSTQAKILADKLKKEGNKVKLIHFPRYDKPIGRLINRIIHGKYKDQNSINFSALQMLYIADQLDFQKELENLMKKDIIVIADRYDLSTIAYYIAKTNADFYKTFSIIKNNWQYSLIRPDITFIIRFNGDLDKRRENTYKQKDILESDKCIKNSISKVYSKIGKEISLNSLMNNSNISDNRNVIYIDGMRKEYTNAKIILDTVKKIILNLGRRNPL